MVEQVRLPAVMASYACGRTLVCCQSSARVYLLPSETRAIRRRLVRQGDADVATRFAGAVERLAPDLAQLRQDADGCVLLDVPARRCDLHATAGIAALPATCRSFPRVVSRTPSGVEAAFLLDCPTAARIVAETPAPFSWAAVARDAWPYEPTRTSGETIPWDARSTLGFDALAALRAAWWSELAAPARWLETSAALLADPETPRSEHGQAVWPDLTGWAGAERVDSVLDAFGQLPTRGPAYHAARTRLEAAFHRGEEATWSRCATTYAPAFSCVVGLALQLAGVHTSAPARDMFRAAAWQARLGVVLMTAMGLEAVGDAITEVDVLGDTLHVAALLSRRATFTR